MSYDLYYETLKVKAAYDGLDLAILHCEARKGDYESICQVRVASDLLEDAINRLSKKALDEWEG